MFKDKLKKAISTLLEIIMDIISLIGMAILIMFGSTIAFDATNIQNYTQAAAGVIVATGGFIGFISIISTLTFRHRKQDKFADLIESWMMNIILNGIMLMSVNLVWHFYISGQMILPSDAQLALNLLLTGLYLLESYKMVMLEIYRFKRAKGELNAELAARQQQ